jgi:hypothetical protein
MDEITNIVLQRDTPLAPAAKPVRAVMLTPKVSAAPSPEVVAVQGALRTLLAHEADEAQTCSDDTCAPGAGEDMPMSSEMASTAVVGVSIPLRTPTVEESEVLEAEAAARREQEEGETPATAVGLVVQGSPAPVHRATYKDWAEGELEPAQGEGGEEEEEEWEQGADGGAGDDEDEEEEVVDFEQHEAAALEELEDLMAEQGEHAGDAEIDADVEAWAAADEDAEARLAVLDAAVKVEDAAGLEELEHEMEAHEHAAAFEAHQERGEIDADVEAWAAADEDVEARLAVLDAALKAEDAAGLEELEHEMEAHEHAAAFEAHQERREIDADVERWATTHDAGAETDEHLAALDAVRKASEAEMEGELEAEMEVQEELEHGVEEWAAADVVAAENKALGNIGRSLLGLLWMGD